MHRALGQGDVDDQVLHHQDRIASRPVARECSPTVEGRPCRLLAENALGHRRRRVTPRASLSPSPTRLNATTVTTMAIPAG